MRLADSLGKMALRFACWFAPLLLALTIAVPVTNRSMKLFQVVLLLSSVVAWLLVIWHSRKLRYSILSLLGLIALLFCLPAGDGSTRKNLPIAFADAMFRYQDTRYWWGGENKLGIDCSGLIRRGMMNAAFTEGLKRLDGGLLRFAASLWWNDCSAKALGEGYRNWTSFIATSPSLNKLDPTHARRGDLAIAGGGSHILACLGDGQWIQADPSAGKVIVEKVPSSNGWLQGNVRIVRWAVLEN